VDRPFRRAPLSRRTPKAASFHRYRDRIYLIQSRPAPKTAVATRSPVTDLAP